MNNDANIEEDMACQLKIDVRNLTNVDPSTRNIKNLHFNGLLLTKYNIMIEIYTLKINE